MTVNNVDNKNYTDVIEHISALRSGSFWELEFSPSLEKNYQFSQNQWYRDTIKVSSMLAVLLLASSYLVEWGTGINVGVHAMLARALAIAALLGTYIYIIRSTHLTWKYWVVSMNTMLVSGALLLIAQDLFHPIKLLYYCNIFFVEVVVFAFIRLPLNFTNTIGFILLLMAAGSLYLDSLSLQMAANVMFFLLSGTLIAVMVAIKTEKMSRESFLKSLLIQHEKEQLRDVNEKLNDQIRLDRVTRLLNRIAFEDQLMARWSLAHQTQQQLVLVAIHIEQFTHFNEKFGPEVGDDLLREVSRKIRSVIIDKEQIACRVSGGRFVILVEGRSNGTATMLEKLRGKLLDLATLKKYPSTNKKVYMSWGRVNMEVDMERDPRGMIDRMFKHLSPIEDLSLHEDVSLARHSSI